MTASSGAAQPFGSWTGGELRSTAEQFSGAGSDSGVDLLVRFVRGVVTVVRRRSAMDRDGADPRRFSIFILAPTADFARDLPREPMLDDGMTPIAGRVWFVNAAVVSGRSKPVEGESPEEVFQFVTDQLALGNLPAVLVDPRLERIEARYYPRGLGQPDDYERVRLDFSDLDIGQITNIIERQYQQCLITPDAQSTSNRLWQKASAHWPHRTAEHRIQGLLRSAFIEALTPCRVYDEFKGVLGRADIHISDRDPVDSAKILYLAVLELKVLRSFSESGTPYGDADNAGAVADGVRQAAGYKMEHGHKVAALCCFDMRSEDSGDSCFDDIRELAARESVALRRWFLYASAALWRKATFPDETIVAENE